MGPEPIYDEEAPPGGSLELESSSVHVKATHDTHDFEVHDFVGDTFVPPTSARKLDPDPDYAPSRGMNDIEHLTEGRADDCGSERLRRERMVLVCDLNSKKAKFELMLQTLRSILGLSNDASWADLLERVEALAEGKAISDEKLLASTDTITCSTAADYETEEAQAEREHLEERLEAQTVQVARLRELLHRQQKLLDMTAEQIHTLHQENKRQEELINNFKQEQEDGTSRENGLRQETERLQEEVFLQQELVAQLDQQAKAEAQRYNEVCNTVSSQAAEIQDLQAEASARDAELVRRRAEGDRDKSKIKELSFSIEEQNEAIDRMRDSLQVYEEAERRKFSYQARTPPDSRTRALRDGSATGSLDDLHSPDASTRGPPLSARTDERSNSNGIRSLAAPGTPGTSASTGTLRRPPSVPAVAMIDDTERDAFLSQFSMSSRTERQMRNRMETDRRRKAWATGATNSARLSSAGSIGTPETN